jgi:hypothetical protein
MNFNEKSAMSNPKGRGAIADKRAWGCRVTKIFRREIPKFWIVVMSHLPKKYIPKSSSCIGQMGIFIAGHIFATYLIFD